MIKVCLVTAVLVLLAAVAVLQTAADPIILPFTMQHNFEKLFGFGPGSGVKKIANDMRGQSNYYHQYAQPRLQFPLPVSGTHQQYAPVHQFTFRKTYTIPPILARIYNKIKNGIYGNKRINFSFDSDGRVSNGYRYPASQSYTKQYMSNSDLSKSISSSSLSDNKQRIRMSAAKQSVARPIQSNILFNKNFDFYLGPYLPSSNYRTDSLSKASSVSSSDYSSGKSSSFDTDSLSQSSTGSSRDYTSASLSGLSSGGSSSSSSPSGIDTDLSSVFVHSDSSSGWNGDSSSKISSGSGSVHSYDSSSVWNGDSSSSLSSGSDSVLSHDSSSSWNGDSSSKHSSGSGSVHSYDSTTGWNGGSNSKLFSGSGSVRVF